MFKKQKLISTALVATFSLLLVIISWFALMQIKKETINNISDSLQSVNYAVQEAHKLMVDNKIQVVESYASSVTLVKLIEKVTRLKPEENQFTHPSQIEIRNLVSGLNSNFTLYGFEIIAPNGINLATDQQTTFKQPSIYRQEYSDLLSRVFNGQSTILPIIKSKLTNQFTITPENTSNIAIFFAAPIKNSQNQVIAVLSLTIDPIDYLNQLTELGQIGDSGETYALTQDGLLLTKSRFRHHLHRANLLQLDHQGGLILRIADPGGNLLQGYQPNIPPEKLPLTAMAKSISQKQSGLNLDAYRDYRGVEVLGVWT
jgi:polar amino acid transport system substrate-binding protein